jgi:hypothetical protein
MLKGHIVGRIERFGSWKASISNLFSHTYSAPAVVVGGILWLVEVHIIPGRYISNSRVLFAMANVYILIFRKNHQVQLKLQKM